MRCAAGLHRAPRNVGPPLKCLMQSVWIRRMGAPAPLGAHGPMPADGTWDEAEPQDLLRVAIH